MATTGITDEGKLKLFTTGWTSYVTTAKLYTNLDSLVNTQTVTFAFDTGVMEWRPTADIVFDVASSTQDVSYVTIGTSTDAYYTKVFTSLYDFTTAGTLTIDSWVFTMSGPNILLNQGIIALFDTGVLTGGNAITQTRLFDSTDNTILDTQAVTFEYAAGPISPTADIVFDVPASVALYIYIYIGETAIFKTQLSHTYTFPTPGTFTVDSWTISIA